MPKFEHVRTGRIIEVSQALAHRYRTSKWRLLDDLSTPIYRAGLEVPKGTVAEIIAWVGDNPYRQAAALDAELAGKNRKSLIDALS